MANIYGYARVSTTGQNLQSQLDELEKYGCTFIKEEKISGTTQKDRVELNTILEFITKGDQLVITKLDRLARNVLDLQVMIKNLESKGASLVILNLFGGKSIDTGNASDKLFIDMLGAFAEFETNLRRERQLSGIAIAKEKGVYKGRKPKATIEMINELKLKGMNNTDIAKELGVTYRSITRTIANNKE